MPPAESNLILSQNKKRNHAYLLFLNLCRARQGLVKDVVRLGQVLMRKEKLYHHFFADHSLRAVAAYLAFFSLKFPHEYDNPAYLNRSLSEEEARAILSLFERRIAERIPLAYLTQEAVYLGRSFHVNEQVLVPRSLMNTRFDEFLARTPWQNYRVLDLCAGSGCIGISLALMNPHLQVDLADISPEALKVAAINVERFALGSRVNCIESDLFSRINGKYDLIITNPPYVSDYEYKWQPPEIKREPALALKGGVDGLALVNRILVEAKEYLNPGGILVAEVGYEAARRLKWRYPHVGLEGLCYKKPPETGKQGILRKISRWSDLPFEWSGLLDGVVLGVREQLPMEISRKSYPVRSWIFRTGHFWRKAILGIKSRLLSC